jgi:hypothetical protein
LNSGGWPEWEIISPEFSDSEELKGTEHEGRRQVVETALEVLALYCQEHLGASSGEDLV